MSTARALVEGTPEIDSATRGRKLAAAEVVRQLALVEPQKKWMNSAGPWVLVHTPSGEFVGTSRILPDGSLYAGFAFKRKRDALAALDALRTEAQAAAADEREAA